MPPHDFALGAGLDVLATIVCFLCHYFVGSFVLNIVIVTNCVIIIFLFEKRQSGSIMRMDIAVLCQKTTSG